MSAWPQYVIGIWLITMLVANLIKDTSESSLGSRTCGVIASLIIFGIEVGILGAGGFWVPLQ